MSKSVSRIVAKIAAVGTLGLAAIAPIALSTAAHAEGRGNVARVTYADLNLSTPAGAAELEARIQSEAGRLCSVTDRTVTGSRIHVSQAACVANVRDQMLAQLPAAAREAVLATARANPNVVGGR